MLWSIVSGTGMGGVGKLEPSSLPAFLFFFCAKAGAESRTKIIQTVSQWIVLPLVRLMFIAPPAVRSRE
jgi:hypothetical protein